MRVILTGSDGFLAWHIRCQLFARGIHEIDLISRSNWSDLPHLMETADAVIHTAAVNRGSDDEISSGNKKITDEIVDALSTTKTGIIFLNANSIQQHGDSVYSKAKKSAGEELRKAVQAVDGIFIDFDIPNVFGQHGKPDYNSFVATFSRDVWLGVKPAKVSNSEVSLVHAQDVAAEMYQQLVSAGEVPFKSITFQAQPTRVDEVWRKLSEFQEVYVHGSIPLLENKFDVDLFNTMRAAQPSIGNPIKLEKFADERGSLQVVVKSEGSGQTFVSTSNPGIVRGEHFHLDKIERFSVIKGQAEISMRKMFTDEIVTYKVNGEEPMTVDMPTLWTHNIRNVGSNELVTMFWTQQLFDEDNPDTYFEKVGD